MIGRQIGHYKILEKLGEGGMGVVYKAEDQRLTRTVALKFLPHGLDAQQPERERFLQEARAAAILNHPNICTVYDIQEHEGQQFIVMEYVEGRTLREIIPAKRMQDAITYAIQIAEALQEAHTHGIVHRDIKAENIMVNTKNQVKVMDFGLAKLKGSLKLTKTSSTIGTLAYMAPEQIQGEEVDARSDIFSFGIVLYEMLTGHLPFRGEHEAAMMYSILNEQPLAIQQYLPDISSEVVHVINRALDKDPEDRYQSAHDMVIDLRRAKKDSTRVVRSSAQQMHPSATEESAVVGSTVGATRSTKRAWYIAVVAFAAVALVAAWEVFHSQQQSRAAYPFSKFTPALIGTQATPLTAALSPDGKYIIYAADESGQQSVWMRQVSDPRSLRIILPQDVQYISFTFSPDGAQIFYSGTSQDNTQGALFVVPALGGTPRKVVSNIVGGAAISPDGTKLAFIRQYVDEGEEALMVSSADGTNERKLVSRKGEDFFVGGLGQAPAWSPDGKTIATAVGSVTGRIYLSVLLVSVADGSNRLATLNRWNNVGRVAWVNDSKGILLVAREYLAEGGPPQLWYVDLATGDVRRITNDLNSYDGSSLSVTADQEKTLALQQSFKSAIEILPGGDSHRARPITTRNVYNEGGNPIPGSSTSGLDWTPDGQIVFQSVVNTNYDIWIMDAEGKNRRQLTTDSYAELSPSVSWDGQFIAFESTRDTTPHIWRMDLDGGNQERLTAGVMDDYNPHCAPDTRWIYFSSFRDKGRRTLWKIPVSGGNPTKVSDDNVFIRGMAISPDGHSIVERFLRTSDNTWHWAILSSDDGKQRKVFDLPTTAKISSIHWMPDGRAIAYIDTRNGVSNIWVLPLETMEAYQLTHFESELIAEFAWSKDGKNLAVVRGEQTNDVVLLTRAK